MSHHFDWLSLGGMSGVECSGSEWLAHSIAILCAIIYIQYFIIARQWWQWSSVNKGREKQALRWMSIVFIFCATAGYGMRIIMIYIPAWSILILVLIGVIIVTSIYIGWSHGMAAMIQGASSSELQLKKLKITVEELQYENKRLKSELTAQESQLILKTALVKEDS